jgi:threonine/homoserine/homoserine lactone efflux protein
MDSTLFVRGMIIGFSIAAPVGPIGVLCIRRTLANGRGVGLATGLGAATADATYGAVAGFGITIISGLLLGAQTWIRLVGGLFLIYLGTKTFVGGPADKPAQAEGRTLLHAYTSAVALTLTNPSTILSFVAIFAGIGAGTGVHAGEGAALLVLGVWSGSALWWLILSSTFAVLHTKITAAQLRWVNRCSGTILIGFGLVALAAVYGG